MSLIKQEHQAGRLWLTNAATLSVGLYYFGRKGVLGKMIKQ